MSLSELLWYNQFERFQPPYRDPAGRDRPNPMNPLDPSRTAWSQYMLWHIINIRGSAIAEEPHDALCQLKYYGRFLTELLTRSFANAQEPCEHTVSWNRVKGHTNVRWIAFENVCKRWMTFKVIQCHCRCYHLIGHILFHISLPL